MNSRRRRMVLGLTAVVPAVALDATALAAPLEAQEPAVPESAVPMPPTMISPLVWHVLGDQLHPVKGTDGRSHLVYALHVINASGLALSLGAVEVVGRDGSASGANRVVASDGVDVTGQVRAYSEPVPKMDSRDFGRHLRRGQGGIVYFDVTHALRRDVPPWLMHRITVRAENGNSYTTTDAGTRVDARDPLVLSPPLRGAHWIVANGSGPILGPHRFSVQPTNAQLRPPEFFAIDVIRLDADGRAVHGDIGNVRNWHYYGSEVVSASHGRVVDVLDGLPNQVPGRPLPPLPIEQFAGNHVIVDCGDGRFALYAHLVPGSVAVRKGQPVRDGQRLGLLGNSGNSDAPHLHFHVMDTASPFNTNGLPFVFDRQHYQGRLMGTLDNVVERIFGGGVPTLDAGGAGWRLRQMPLTLDVLGFT